VLERVLGLLAPTRYFLRSAGDLPLAVFLVTRTHALDAPSQSLFLQQLPLLTFPMGDVRVFASTPDL